MQSTNKLGIKVAIISAIAVLLVFGAVLGIKALIRPTIEQQNILQQATPLSQPDTTRREIEAAVDKDNDGLVDEIEPLYQADPTNPDTDGDGTLDGDELTLLRNPAVAGPNDTLNFLQSNGELDTTTYTGRYLATLPASATQADILSSEKLEAFIKQESGDLLPEVPLSDIKQSQEEGASAIETYLGLVSATHNKDLVAVTSEDITNAFQAAYTDTSGAALQTIIDSLTDNLLILRAVVTPSETVVLHQKILSASEALLTSVELLATMQTDFVGGLIGAKNIEDLGPVFNEIAQEISALETKYNLE